MLLLIPVLASVMVRGEEASMREKLHAKIMASAPQPAAKPAGDPNNSQAPSASPVVMTPLVVSGSTVVREVTAALARAEEYRIAEKFSPLSGGTLYSGKRLQIGGWWTPSEGWTFLRLNKRPGPHQVQDTAARIKELEELAALGKKRKGTPNAK